MISRRVLGTLVVLLLASLYYGYTQTPRQERRAPVRETTESKPPAVGRRATANAVRAGEIPRLRTDLLDRHPAAYSGVRRDLFHSGRITVETPPEVDVEAEIAAPVAPVPTPALTPPPPPTPQDLAKQDLSRFKFLGFFKKGEKRTIFLSSSGEIFLVRKGEVFGRNREFKVTDLTATTLKLSKEGVGEFSVQLVDQAPLSAVTMRSEPSVPSPDNASLSEGPVGNPSATLRQLNRMRGVPAQQQPEDQPEAEDQFQPEEEPNETRE